MFNIADELCWQCMRADWRRKGSTPSPSVGIPFRVIYSRQKRDDRSTFHSKPSVLRLRPRLFRFSEKTYCSECSSFANRNERKRGSIWKQGIVSQVDEWRVKNANEKYFADEFNWSDSVSHIINVTFHSSNCMKAKVLFPISRSLSVELSVRIREETVLPALFLCLWNRSFFKSSSEE